MWVYSGLAFKGGGKKLILTKQLIHQCCHRCKNFYNSVMLQSTYFFPDSSPVQSCSELEHLITCPYTGNLCFCTFFLYGKHFLKSWVTIHYFYIKVQIYFLQELLTLQAPSVVIFYLYKICYIWRLLAFNFNYIIRKCLQGIFRCI
jgi:hypothetical protein